jgi:hypothetical protein
MRLTAAEIIKAEGHALFGRCQCQRAANPVKAEAGMCVGASDGVDRGVRGSRPAQGS